MMALFSQAIFELGPVARTVRSEWRRQ